MSGSQHYTTTLILKIVYDTHKCVPSVSKTIGKRVLSKTHEHKKLGPCEIQMMMTRRIHRRGRDWVRSEPRLALPHTRMQETMRSPCHKYNEERVLAVTLIEILVLLGTGSRYWAMRWMDQTRFINTGNNSPSIGGFFSFSQIGPRLEVRSRKEKGPPALLLGRGHRLGVP